MDTTGEKRSAETYARLINAAVDEVFDHGYAGATMTRIAKRAGLTRGAIQHHFGDRRVDIITKVTEHILSLRQDAYTSYYARVHDGEVVDTRASIKAAYRDPATWFLIEVWIASKADPELHERIAKILHKVSPPPQMQGLAPLANLTPNQFQVIKYTLRSLTRGIALEYAQMHDELLFDSVVDFVIDAVNLKLKMCI